MTEYIDLDHAATTRLRPQALEAMLPYLTGEQANASGAYAAGRRARAAIDRARAQIAACIGAQPGEIYFTSGGTEADNWAVFGAMRAAQGEKRGLAVSSVEHPAVLRAAQALSTRGCDVAYLPVDAQARVDVCEAEARISPRTALVSVMLANNEVGTIEPVAEIARIAHAAGALMHTDAVQAAGQIPVDVNALGVDLLSMSAHKFGGPKGVGALFVREGAPLGRLLFGGEQERGMRAGSENTAAIVGMGEALALAVEEMETQRRRVTALRDRLAAGALACWPGARLNGGNDRLPGHVHLTLPGADSRSLLLRLDLAGIAASAGSACAAGAAERSHVLAAMSAPPGADLRLTLGADSTAEDVECALKALSRLAPRER